MTGTMIPRLISSALTFNDTKLYLIYPHGDPRNPPPVPGQCNPLTSGGWSEGWSRRLTPGSPSSHSTVSPPRRRSPSGRLPAAPAPSPSRARVRGDGRTRDPDRCPHKSRFRLGERAEGPLALHQTWNNTGREVPWMLRSGSDALGSARPPSPPLPPGALSPQSIDDQDPPPLVYLLTRAFTVLGSRPPNLSSAGE